MNDIYQDNLLQERQGASPALTPSGCAQADVPKGTNKNADKFTAHCSDSLTLAADVLIGEFVEPGPFLVFDDKYRSVRRKLYDTQPARGGIKEPYSHGTVLGLRKGLIVGLPKGRIGQLCGELKGGYRYYG